MPFPKTPIAYLRQELGFTIEEWAQLSDIDKEGLEEAAREEMGAKGIPIRLTNTPHHVDHSLGRGGAAWTEDSGAVVEAKVRGAE